MPYGDAEAIGAALATGGGRSCVIFKPIQAENGVVIPPEGYLREVRRLCDVNGAFLVLDEIQTGLGRLGSWWGADREQVIPDILLAGKALGGGVMPIGAVLTSASAFARLNRDPFLHTSTFAGNPLAMAAAEAAIPAQCAAATCRARQDAGRDNLDRTEADSQRDMPRLDRRRQGRRSPARHRVPPGAHRLGFQSRVTPQKSNLRELAEHVPRCEAYSSGGHDGIRVSMAL